MVSLGDGKNHNQMLDLHRITRKEKGYIENKTGSSDYFLQVFNPNRKITDVLRDKNEENEELFSELKRINDSNLRESTKISALCTLTLLIVSGFLFFFFLIRVG